MSYRILSQYSACDIADALVALDRPDGGSIPHLIQQSTGPAMAGPAYTVLYAPISDSRPALSTHYIDNAPSGAVILIGTTPELQQDGAPYCNLSNALYGGLMSTRAKYLNCAGTVVLGKIRDIGEHRRLGYPVFSYGLGIASPNKAAKVVAVNCPLTVPGSDLVVNAGDIIVGDENGVATYPPGLHQSVLELIPPRIEADALAAEDIANGVPAGEAQKNRRKNIKK